MATTTDVVETSVLSEIGNVPVNTLVKSSNILPIISTTPYIVTTIIFLIIIIGLSIYLVIASINKMWPFVVPDPPPLQTNMERPYGPLTPLSQLEIDNKNISIYCYYRTRLPGEEIPAALQLWLDGYGVDRISCDALYNSA
jgi:hypothetical protein